MVLPLRASGSSMADFSKEDKKILEEEAKKQGITNPRALRHFMSQVKYESGGKLLRSERSGYRDAKNIKRAKLSSFYKKQTIAPKELDPEKPIQEQKGEYRKPTNKEIESWIPRNQIKEGTPKKVAEELFFNKAYGKEGYKYRGRGAIQLTHKDNYKRYAPEAVDNPDLVSTDKNLSARAAARFFKDKTKNIDFSNYDKSDKEISNMVTDKINKHTGSESREGRVKLTEKTLKNATIEAKGKYLSGESLVSPTEEINETSNQLIRLDKKKRTGMKGNDEDVYFGDVISSKKKQKKGEIRDPFDRSNVPVTKEVVTPPSIKDNPAPVQEEKKKEGVSSQFKDALGFFLPQIIGGLAGAAFEGTEGAIGGIEQSGKARDAFLKHQDDKERLAIEKSKEGRLNEGRDRFQLSTMQNDKGESEVFRVNLDTGEKESLGTKGYAKGYVKDPNSGFLVNKQTGRLLNLSGDSTNKTFFSALTPVQRSQFSNLRKGFLTESKPMRDAAAKVEGLISKQVDEAMVNSVAANQLGAQVASIYENGRLTDEDVLRYTRRTGIPDRIADMIKDLKHGTISADKAEDIKSALTVLREVVIDQVNTKAKERSDVFSSDWGLPSEDVNQAFWKKMSNKKRELKNSNEPTLQERIRAAESSEELAEIMKESRGKK